MINDRQIHKCTHHRSVVFTHQFDKQKQNLRYDHPSYRHWHRRQLTQDFQPSITGVRPIDVLGRARVVASILTGDGINHQVAIAQYFPSSTCKREEIIGRMSSSSSSSSSPLFIDHSPHLVSFEFFNGTNNSYTPSSSLTVPNYESILSPRELRLRCGLGITHDGHILTLSAIHLRLQRLLAEGWCQL